MNPCESTDLFAFETRDHVITATERPALLDPSNKKREIPEPVIAAGVGIRKLFSSTVLSLYSREASLRGLNQEVLKNPRKYLLVMKANMSN